MRGGHLSYRRVARRALLFLAIALPLYGSAPAIAADEIIVEDITARAHVSGVGGYDMVKDEATRETFVQEAPPDSFDPFAAHGNVANTGAQEDQSWGYDISTDADSDVDLVEGVLDVHASGKETAALTTAGGGYALSDSGLTWVQVIFAVTGERSASYRLAGTMKKSFIVSGTPTAGCGNGGWVYIVSYTEQKPVVQPLFPSTDPNGTLTFDEEGTLPPGRYALIAGTDVVGPAYAGNGTLTCGGEYDFDFRVDAPWDCTTTTDGVKVGNALACGSTLKPVEAGSKVYSTPDTAWVGGFEIRPRVGGTLVVDTAANQLREEGTGVDVMFAGVAMPVPLGAIPINQTGGEFELGGAGTLEANLLDLPLEGKAKVAWADNGSAATFEMEVDFDKLIADWGTPANPATGAVVDGSGGKLAARLQNGKGFILDAAEVKAGEISVVPRVLRVQRTLTVKDVLLKYALVNGKHTFAGQATLGVPFLKGKIDATGRVSVYDFSVAGGGLSVSGFNRPIPGAAALFLKSVEGDLQFIPSFGFNLGLVATIGPQVAGTELTEITANARGLALASGCTLGQDPIELALVAKLTPVEQAGLGKATLSGTACVYVTSEVLEGRFKAEAALGGGLFPELMGFEGEVVGWISSSALNYEGTGTLRLPGLPDLSGKEVISSKGIAACTELSVFDFFSGGFGYTWGGAAPQAFSGCDLMPWRETVAASPAAASKRRTVAVRRRVPFVGFSAQTRDGAPRLRVTGPRGERFQSPASGNLLIRPGVVIARIPKENRTYVFVRRPSRGRWRIESLGTPITGIRTSNGLAKPRVNGAVRRVRKTQRYALRYRIRPIAGQRVEFFDRADGVARRLGKATRRRRGTVRFKPVAAADRTHVIEATITQNGLPRDRLVVAKYRVR